MLRTTLRILLVVGTFSVLSIACSDDFGEPCDLPRSGNIRAFCDDRADESDGTAGGSTATCVFTNSAQCDSRMCAQYIGSREFCTVECDADVEGSCPGGSFCHAVPATDLAFCVPNSLAD